MSQLCIYSGAGARQVLGANKGTTDTALPWPEKLFFLQGVNISRAPTVPHLPPPQAAAQVPLSPGLLHRMDVASHGD